MPQCSAINCKNRGVHLFPKDPKHKKQWKSALRIQNFKASASVRLCSMHFRAEDYFGRSAYTGNEPLARFLRKTAVPSIFCFTKVKPETPAALERQHRFEKRNQRKLFQEEPQPSTSKVELQDAPEPNLVPAVAYEEIINDKNTCMFNMPTHLNSSPLSKITQVDHEHMYGSIYRHKDDNEAIKFYTGFESYKKFHFVYSTLSPMAHKIKYYGNNVINMSTENQFFLTMMKLRQNKCNFEFGKFFNVSPSTVSNIFITWVNFLYQLWTTINIWPSKEMVQYFMPESFKNYDPNIRVILDGTEIRVQKPKNPKSQ